MLDDRRAFGEDRAVLIEQRRFSERVDGLQFGRRAHRLGISRVAFDLIGQPHFLEAPQEPLRAAVFEMMDNAHKVSLKDR